MSRRLGLVLAAALLLRIVPILAADRVVADVLRYQKAARHVLDVSWNPYLAPRLYPYPPLWIWVEAGSEWLSRATGLSFAVLVKLPVLAADLGIVLLLARWPGDERVAQRASWLFALHPISILVTSFHGQFDSIMLFFVLLSLRFHQSGRFDASALSLSAAIATKSFPALLLPFFVLSGRVTRAVRFTVLATLPVLLILLPYAIADAGALARELLGYGGVADFGWIGVWRGWRLMVTGALARAEAAHWPGAVLTAKTVFLAVYAAGLWAYAAGRLRRWTLPQAALAVFLAFLTFYGAVSAQYLVWPVPFGALLGGVAFVIYSIVATKALLGFYFFLAPGVLTAAEVERLGRHDVAVVWAVGATAVLISTAGWLVAVVRRGRRRA